MPRKRRNRRAETEPVIDIELTDDEGYVIPDENMRGPRITELLSLFTYADGHREQFVKEARECYRLYMGEPESVVEGRSNLFIPRTYEEVDTIRARMVKSFFSTRPYIDFNPSPTANATPETMAANSEKGILAASILSTQLDRNKIVQVFYNFVTDFLIKPASILQVGWRYETKEVERGVPILRQHPFTGEWYNDFQMVIEDAVIWDDNEITNVEFTDFWVDPRGKDLDEARYVFHREFLTREQIESRLELLERGQWGQVYELDWEAIAGASTQTEGVHEFMEEAGLSTESSDAFMNANRGSKMALYEVLHYWTDKDHAIILNRCALAFDGQNPYEKHGKKPFVVATFEPLSNQFYGLSAVKIIKHLQAELNTNRNQRIDNVSFVLNRMWKVRKSANLRDDELISRPHGKIEVNNLDDIEPIITPDVTASAYNEESIIKQDMENVLAVPSVVRGVSSSKDETATEVVTKSSNAGIRFDTKIMVYECMSIERLAYLCDCNNQQFMDAARVARIYGMDGPDQWRMVDPMDIQGEWDYTPSGSNTDPAANREVKRQQFTQLMTVAQNIPFIKQYELVKLWLGTFDIRDVNKILKSPEEMAYEQQQAAMQAQQEAAMAAQAQGMVGPDGTPMGPGGPMIGPDGMPMMPMGPDGGGMMMPQGMQQIAM